MTVVMMINIIVMMVLQHKTSSQEHAVFNKAESRFAECRFAKFSFLLCIFPSVS